MLREMWEAVRAAEDRGWYVGVDVGGTKTRVLALGPGGESREREEPTDPDSLTQITRLVRGVAGDGLAAVGVGVPGAVCPRTGAVTRVPNVPSLTGIRLAQALAETLAAPVHAANDVSAAAAAESRLTPGSEGPLAVLAAGTGIGLGYSIDGVVVRGATGGAGEIGDMPYLDGRLEDVLSTDGFLAAYAREGGERTRGVREVVDAAPGDVAAARARATYAEHLAAAIMTVAAILDPSAVILSGGLGVALGEAARAQASLTAEVRERTRISLLGDRAPVVGGLVMALDAAGASADVRRDLDAAIRGRMVGSLG